MSLSTSAVNILIGSKADLRGFKKAETATAKLNKSVKNLGRTLGFALSAAAITAYGKAAVKAAADDAKAQAILAQQLKNVGQAYAVTQVEAYISTQEQLTGILDDQLRPAFSKLVTVTGSATQSQYLLNVAMDAAAGTGQDVVSVSQALAQAYQGNMKGLKSLNLGWTAAQMKAAKFSDVIERINQLYKGQGKVAADSYAGSLQKINTAAKNASETIGYGLIDAVKMLGRDNSVDSLAKSMNDFATNTAYAIRGVGSLAATLKNLPGLGGGLNLNMIPLVGPYLNLLINKGKKASTGSIGGAADRRNMYLAKKAADLQKTNNSLKQIDNGLITRKIALTADEQALLELQKTFDLDRIQIQAALNGKIDEETRARLDAMMVAHDQDVANAQLALSALKASGAIEGMASALGGMSAAMKALMNPMVITPNLNISGNQNGVWSNQDVQYLGDVYASNAINRLDNIENSRASTYAAQGGVNVTVNVAGSVTTERDLVSKITQGIYNNQASGIPVGYSTQY